jgi:hypothetical protein
VEKSEDNGPVTPLLKRPEEAMSAVEEKRQKNAKSETCKDIKVSRFAFDTP